MSVTRRSFLMGSAAAAIAPALPVVAEPTIPMLTTLFVGPEVLRFILDQVLDLEPLDARKLSRYSRLADVYLQIDGISFKEALAAALSERRNRDRISEEARSADRGHASFNDL